MNEKLNEIKRIIIEELEKENIKVHKIILFGSRARGDFKEDSDWDILVVVDRKLSFCKKWDIIDRIKLKLARNKIPNDIILKSHLELFENKNNIGSVVYYAIKEGKEI
jgi:predicted nucleotidyltransferase